MPKALQETVAAEALRAICDLDLQELQTVEPAEFVDASDNGFLFIAAFLTLC